MITIQKFTLAFFAIQEYNETRNGELAILQAESRRNAS